MTSSTVKMADGRRSIIRQSAATGLARVLRQSRCPRGESDTAEGFSRYEAVAWSMPPHDGRLHQVDLETGGQEAITPPAEGVAAPVISPCGRFVAFLCEKDGKCNVLLAELGGKALPVKLSDDPWYAFNPAFSMDGRGSPGRSGAKWTCPGTNPGCKSLVWPGPHPTVQRCTRCFR